MAGHRFLFVGHVFDTASRDDLRAAVSEAAGDWTPIYADERTVDGHILTEKIVPDLRRSSLCLFEISNLAKPNVFIELGIAKGLGKPSVLLVRSGTAVPSDLAGLDRVEYGSYQQLTSRLANILANPPVRPVPLSGKAGARGVAGSSAKIIEGSGTIGIASLLEAATGEVCFLGLSGNPLETTAGAWDAIVDRATAGCRFRFLYAHPRSEYLRQRATEEDGQRSARLALQVISTLRSLDRVSRAVPDTSAIEVRLYRRPPRFALILVDDLVLVGPYLFGARGLETPWFVTRHGAAPRVYEAFLASFEWLWRDPTTAPWPDDALRKTRTASV